MNGGCPWNLDPLGRRWGASLLVAVHRVSTRVMGPRHTRRIPPRDNLLLVLIKRPGHMASAHRPVVPRVYLGAPRPPRSLIGVHTVRRWGETSVGRATLMTPGTGLRCVSSARAQLGMVVRALGHRLRGHHHLLLGVAL